MILIVYIVFCVTTLPIMLAKSRLFSFIYFFLFMYSVFAVTGYLYIPGYSESLSAYFGQDVGFRALNFIFISMIGLFLVNFWIYPVGYDRRPGIFKVLIKNEFNPSAPGIILTWLILSVFIFLLAFVFDRISWYNAEEAESLDNFRASFIGLYKISVGLIATIYFIARLSNKENRLKIIIPLLIYIVAFAVASARLGNRTDPAALIVGIGFFEISRYRISLSLILKGLFIAGFAFFVLSLVEYFRYYQTSSDIPLLERLIKNDYFAPAHMLFAAIAYNFVDAGEVIKSNLSNAAILMNYPYLQQSVTDLFNPGVATRSSGYAFYILTEGFIFGGDTGIIYNIVFITIAVRVWNSVASTDNLELNLIIRSLLATMAINVVRGQGSYFVKYSYTYFAPVFLFLVILIAVRFKLPKLR